MWCLTCRTGDGLNYVKSCVAGQSPNNSVLCSHGCLWIFISISNRVSFLHLTQFLFLFLIVVHIA